MRSAIDIDISRKPVCNFRHHFVVTSCPICMYT